MTPIQVADRHKIEWAWFVIALGVVLRFQGLDWDQGLNLNPDERNIATAAVALGFPDHLVPQFHAYNGLAVYLPRLLAEAIAPLSGRSGTDLNAVVFAGRLLSASYGALVLPVLWSIARRTMNVEMALFSAICAAASPALIQSSHFATTESGLMLCLSLILWLCQRHIAGDLKLMPFAASCGLLLGFGFGLKTTALAFAVCPVVAASISTLRFGLVGRTLKAGALAGIVVLVIGLASTPQLVTAPSDYLATMQFEAAVVRGSADVFWTLQFIGTRPVLFELSQLPWLVGPLLAPIALAGSVVLANDLRLGRLAAFELAPALIFAVIYFVIITAWHAKFVRYMAPLVPILILFSAYFIAQLRGRLMFATAMVTAIATALVGLMQAAIYQIKDPRVAAWEWLAPRLQPGATMVVEPADVGPPYWEAPVPFKTAVLPVLDPSSPQKTTAMAEILAEGRWIIVASRRHSGVLPRLKSRFREMCGYYEALWSGRLGYRAVATFRRRRSLPRMLDPTTEAEETFTVFDSPQVYILAKTEPMTVVELTTELNKIPAGCQTR